MSTLKEPRGPLPPRVYWVRRAAVLGVALVVVIGLATLLTQGSDGSDAASDTATNSAAEVKTPAPVEPSKLSESAAKKKAKKASKALKKAAATAEPSGPCDPADITTTVRIKNKQAGKTIDVALRFYTTELACTFDVSPSNVRLSIKKGGDIVWSTQDCPKAVESQDMVLRSAAPARVFVPWNGRESTPKCGVDGWAMPGDYRAQAAALGGEPGTLDFTLTKPVAKTVTASPKPKPSKSSPSGAVVPQKKKSDD